MAVIALYKYNWLTSSFRVILFASVAGDISMAITHRLHISIGIFTYKTGSFLGQMLINWLVVLSHPSEKYGSQIGSSQLLGEIKNVPNHQPDGVFVIGYHKTLQ